MCFVVVTVCLVALCWLDRGTFIMPHGLVEGSALADGGFEVRLRHDANIDRFVRVFHCVCDQLG